MRRLSDGFMEELKSGSLVELVDRVNGDPELELFIRENYLNVYYHGNSVLKLSEVPGTPIPTFHLRIDDAYIRAAGTATPTNAQEWLAVLPLIKEGVRIVGRTRLGELAAEQHFIHANNRAGHKTEYYVVDRQYGEERTSGGRIGNALKCRPDLLAIRWPREGRSRSKQATPVLIEVKYGMNEDIGDVHEQVARYHEMLQGKLIITEMQELLAQRAELGLFGEESPALAKLGISGERTEAEIIVLLADYNPHSSQSGRTEDKLAQMGRTLGVRISIAHVGYALWDHRTRNLNGEPTHLHAISLARHDMDSFTPNKKAIRTEENEPPRPARKQTINGRDYLLPQQLSRFQQDMYVRLIDWKRKEITAIPGEKNNYLYDAVLPTKEAEELRHIYEPVREVARKLTYKRHKHSDHVASSQVACLNLFLPILQNPAYAAKVLHLLAKENAGNFRIDFQRLAEDHLNGGYEFEYWGSDVNNEPGGLLGDKSDAAGTDSDLAIAYYNTNKKPCLWLIEHKLTEAEFTTCGAYKKAMTGKTPERYNCDAGFSQVLCDHSTCYYTDPCKYRYWEITARHPEIFSNPKANGGCPFKGGMNQLWRNQLLALAFMDSGVYDEVHFSVVKHPGNPHLEATLEAYNALIGNSPHFSVLDSSDVITAAETVPELQAWTKWYREVYGV